MLKIAPQKQYVSNIWNDCILPTQEVLFGQKFVQNWKLPKFSVIDLCQSLSGIWFNSKRQESGKMNNEWKTWGSLTLYNNIFIPEWFSTVEGNILQCPLNDWCSEKCPLYYTFCKLCRDVSTFDIFTNSNANIWSVEIFNSFLSASWTPDLWSEKVQ